MANTIKIKRKPLANGAGVPVLVGGELAFSEADAKLFYGLDSGGSVLPIEIAGSGYVLAKIADYAPSKSGTNASGTWNISVTGNAATVTNGVYTSGNQSITGVKTFVNEPFFGAGISVSGVVASANSGTYFPVFTGNPNSTQQDLVTRTPSEVKSDIGLGNVENTALSTYSRDGIDSRTSFPPSSHAITSHGANNWKIFYSNSLQAVQELSLGSSGLVLKSNGANAAPSWEVDNNTVYTHPTQTAITESAANGKVLSAIQVNTLGHVTSVGTKTLAEDDIPALAQSKITNLTTDLANKLPLSGGTLTNFLTLHADPTNDSHAATKKYVDATRQGLDVKQSVRVATTQNIYLLSTASNVLSAGSNGTSYNIIDGVTLALNNRVLIKDQNGSSGSVGPAYNGIYTVTQLGGSTQPLILTRALDTDESSEITPGMFTFVEEGTNNADTGWVLTTNGNITVNSSTLAFAQFSAAGQIYDGSGLIKVGSTIHVGQGTGILVSDDSVSHADTSTLSGIQGGNGISSITVDGFGHVTAVGTPSSAYLTSDTVCNAITGCTIDGGTF